MFKLNLSSKLSRFKYATSYYNSNYKKIWDWTFESQEDTNYTYELTDRNMLYLAHFISASTRATPNEVLNYLQEPIKNETLKNHIICSIQNSKFSHKADLRSDFGRRLGWYAFVRLLRPKVIVETGVDKGLGSILLCEGLRRNQLDGYTGQYFGTDINPDAGYLLSGEYAKFGKILYGDSIESLKNFDKEIDLFINDSDHSQEYEYSEYLTIASKLNKHSFILGDNSHCSESLAKFSLATNRNFIFFKEEPKNHWYPGAGIGISYLSYDKITKD